MKKEITKDDLQNLDKDLIIDMFLQQQANLQSMSERLDHLTEMIALSNQRAYGSSSEKGLSDILIDNQLYISFNEVEYTIEEAGDASDEEEERIEVPAHTRARKKGVRKEDLSGLQREIIIHDATDEDKASLGDNFRELPDEVYDKLKYIPAAFIVEEHHVKVYAGPDDRFVKGERPKDAFPGSIATPELVSGIFNSKYVNGMPVARIEKDFERMEINIRRQTMCRWLDRTKTHYITPLYNALKDALTGFHVIQANETPVQVNKAHTENKDGSEEIKKKKCYMWVYKNGAFEPRRIVLYDYKSGRKGEYPEEFLRKFHGICVSDGYQVYHTIDDEREDIQVAGCWAHAKRPFATLVKALGKKAAKGSVAKEAVRMIDTFYHYEKRFKDMPPDERLKARQDKIAPLVDVFFEWAKKMVDQVGSKSVRDGLNYCINQEKYLRIFLTDGEVPIDNNSAEQSIRPFVTGRKAWLFCDTESGAETSAMLYSIAETAKANRLKPYEYMKYILTEMAAARIDRSTIDEEKIKQILPRLLPWSDAIPDICRMKEK